MKFMTIGVLLAICTILPVIIVGAKYGDGPFTDNTYNRSLDYDAGKEFVENSNIVWSEPDCDKGVCRITVSVIPLPDQGSMRFRVFRPADSKELALSVKEDGSVWEGSFEYNGDGWYIHRIDFTSGGKMVNDEKSYFYKDPYGTL